MTQPFPSLSLDYFAGGATAADMALCQRTLTRTELMSWVEFYALAGAVTAAHGARVGSACSSERQRWDRIAPNLINNARVDDVASLALVVRGLDGRAVTPFRQLVSRLGGGPSRLVRFQCRETDQREDQGTADFAIQRGRHC